MKRVYFVRHGETEGNAGHYFQDESTPLTELGHDQARQVGERVSHLTLDALIASPFVRTQQTAKHISEHVGLPVETFGDFHECMQPVVMRGRSKTEGEGLKYQESYLQHYVQDEVFAEGFENFNMVISRVKSCVDFLKNHKSKSIIVVSHAAIIHTIAAYLLLQETIDVHVNVPLSFSLQDMTNSGISEFEYQNGVWKLITWNNQSHFAE